jgi:hypothetical protein
MARSEAIIAELGGQIPSRALDTVRTAVLGHMGSAALLLRKLEQAEARFSASVALIDSIGGSDLAGLRQQLVASWVSARRQSGRSIQADALEDGSIPLHQQSALCGCGHPHLHDHHHDDQHGDERGGHHKHHDNCGCGHAH